MKFLIVALILLVASHLQGSDLNQTRLVFVRKYFTKTRNVTVVLPNSESAQVEKYLHYHNIGINQTQSENALEEAGRCVEEAYNDLASCSFIDVNQNCTNKSPTNLDTSITDRLKDTPTLALEKIHSVAQCICNSNTKAKQLIELVNPCVVENAEIFTNCFLPTLGDKTVNIAGSKCKQVVAEKLELESANVLVFSATLQFRTCWDNTVNKKCKHEITKKTDTLSPDATSGSSI